MKKYFFGIFLAAFGMAMTANSFAASSFSYIKNNVDGSQTLTGHVPPEVRNATAAFKYHASQSINAQIIMPLANQSQLNSLLQDLYDPQSPDFHHFLTPTQFAQQFAPSVIDSTLVQEFLNKAGISVIEHSPNGAVLSVTGPVGAFERAFGLHINYYQKSDGTMFFAPDADPVIPVTLAGKILAVGGLDDLPKYMAHRQQYPMKVLPKASGSGPGGFLAPNDVKTAYNLNSVPSTGSGQSVALFELDGYTSNDITAYESHFGLPSVPLQNVLIDGFSGTPNYGSNGGADEVTLDIELVAAFAPGSSDIFVYEAPNTTQSWMDEWTQIATDDKAKVISCSWGEPEMDSPTLSFDNGIFEQMAAQGQAVFVASGDSGAFDAGGNTLAVDEPASQPYVTAVGISKLTTNVSGAYSSETASIYGGGGISWYWSIPSYQTTLAAQAVTAAKVSKTMRNLPDVVLTADASTAYAFYIEGSWWGYFGSSLSSPIWASFISRVNQGLGASGPIGSVNSALYQIAQTSSYSNDFHDITTGNNGYYPAESGFDDATGLGSFNGLNLYNDLVKASAATPPSAPTGLSATAGNAQVSLSWTASTGATSYNVERSTVNGGSYTIIASSVLNTTYTDHSVIDGTTYYYVVSAVNSAGPGTNSAQASATLSLVTNLSITYPVVSNGQILVNFTSNQALTRGGVTVQVAVNQAGPWYTLSGNYGFAADGNNMYTVSFPASSYPAYMLVKIANQSPQQVFYTLAASAGSGGTISPSGSMVVSSGANQIFTVTPNTGNIASLTVDGTPVVLTNNTYTLNNITASHTVAGSFSSSQIEIITASAGTNGTISPSGAVSVNYGASRTFTVTPNTGYNASLTVDGIAAALTNNTYIFSNVTAAHTIAVSFVLQTRIITASTGTNGTISPSGAVSVNYGASQVFTVTPNTGYTANLTVDGIAAALTNNTYTFSNVITTHTIVASFTASALSIMNLTTTYPTSPNGQIVVTFTCAQALTKANVIVQVAAPSAPTVWYTLSGNYSFTSNGNNKYTVSLPASGFPANTLVNVELKVS